LEPERIVLKNDDENKCGGHEGRRFEKGDGENKRCGFAVGRVAKAQIGNPSSGARVS